GRRRSRIDLSRVLCWTNHCRGAGYSSGIGAGLAWAGPGTGACCTGAGCPGYRDASRGNSVSAQRPGTRRAISGASGRERNDRRRTAAPLRNVARREPAAQPVHDRPRLARLGAGRPGTARPDRDVTRAVYLIIDNDESTGAIRTWIVTAHSSVSVAVAERRVGLHLSTARARSSTMSIIFGC